MESPKHEVKRPALETRFVHRARQQSGRQGALKKGRYGGHGKQRERNGPRGAFKASWTTARSSLISALISPNCWVRSAFRRTPAHPQGRQRPWAWRGKAWLGNGFSILPTPPPTAFSPSRHRPLIGPSPRVRGTASTNHVYDCPRPVHPRVCGEQSFPGIAPQPGNRSIPACAGNSHPSAAADCKRPRSIPACAGNRLLRAAAAASLTVHPRVCGEQACMASPGRGPPAVHPRVCGEQAICPRGAAHNRRSIPACAGNSIWGEALARAATVIPACAGNSMDAGIYWRDGKRSIPACAGNSSEPAVQNQTYGGPSPRVRGTAHLRPVHASWLLVHPRVCGEQLGLGLGGGGGHRSIPACAGNR